MLTDEQKKQFCLAISFGGKDNISYESGDCYASVNDVVETYETMEDFFKSLGVNGRYKLGKLIKDIGWNDTPFGKFYKWENVTAENGKKLKEVCVMDFGNARAVYASED